MHGICKSPTDGTWDQDSASSTLHYMPEQELRHCPDTPEHQAVCLKFVTKRVQQLGYLVPESLLTCHRQSCRTVMQAHDNDLLMVLTNLLDCCERMREERDELRASDKLLRHEAGRTERRSASLERSLVTREKKLADCEYRLQEQTQQADRLRAELKREAQRARAAEAELRRQAELVRHRKLRAERELFEAKQRLERTDRRLPLSAAGQCARPQNSKVAAAKPVPRSERQGLTAGHAVVMTTDLFETVELPPLNRHPGSPAGRRARNVSASPARQIWYKVPDGASCGSDCGAGELSVISLAETIDAGVCGCQGPDSSAAFSVPTSTIGGRDSSGSRGRQGKQLRD